LKFNNIHTKSSNAMKLAQIESPMHKRMQGLYFVAFGFCKSYEFFKIRGHLIQFFDSYKPLKFNNFHVKVQMR